MISPDRAKELAEETVAALGAARGDEFALICDKTIEVSGGWVFFYNSREFIETGNPISALAGNGPIFVDRGGAIHHLASAVASEEAIRRALTLLDRVKNFIRWRVRNQIISLRKPVTWRLGGLVEPLIRTPNLCRG
jgi:Immunity protein 35